MRLDELEDIEDFADDKDQYQGRYESGLSIGSRIAFVMIAIVVGVLFVVSTL